MRPFRNRILVKLNKKKTESEGVLLPETSNSEPRTALVIAIGDTVEHIAVGNTVVLPKGDLIEIDIKGSTHIIIPDGDILAII